MIGRSDWVLDRNYVTYGDAHQAALHGHTSQSAAKARRLRTEADKLEAYAAVALAAATAPDQAAYEEVKRAAAKTLREKFGGGSVVSACAWLAGKAGQAALDSVLNGEVELTSLRTVDEIAEAVILAKQSETT